jgi:valyl-tRNA synthetase
LNLDLVAGDATENDVLETAMVRQARGLFDAAHLLGLCFLDKERPMEARRLFQEALRAEGIPKEKIMEIELALNSLECKKKESALDVMKRNREEKIASMASKILDKSYDPHQVEEKWYRYWMDRGYFRADEDSKQKAYSIVIPPPNVTGSLHIGHALNNTLQDILIRYKRMKDYTVLWMPGTDHAGIATQNVVERQLMEEGLDRHLLGREKFIERVWKWKAEYGGKIIRQLKSLGASCDWSKERFTLDEGLSRAVREVFVRLYEEGLIYRDDRLINWCPRCQTALSDLEVEHEEFESKLFFIKYPLSDGSGSVTVATTRPETMLGDTAVAVHPEDERYKDRIGKIIDLPLTERKICYYYKNLLPLWKDDARHKKFLVKHPTHQL